MSQINTSARRQLKKDKPENRKTLDIQHNQMIDKLNEVKSSRDQLCAKVTKIDETIDKLRAQFAKTQDDKVMDKILALQDEMLDLKQRRASLESKSHVNYFLETSDILYKYYEMVENGGASESVAPVKPVQNSILSWFASTAPPAPAADSSDAATDLKPKPAESKTSLIEKFMQRTNNNYINPCDKIESACASCGSHDVMLVPSEGQIVCNGCHCVEHVILDHEKPSYKDPPKEISYWAYKRINHFIMEWKSGLVSLVMRLARHVLLF